MTKKQNEKTCENCRYFLQYYIRRSIHYAPVLFGHCKKDDISVKGKIKRPFTPACPLWETVELKKEEEKKSIKILLTQMAKQIKEISIYLKNEKITSSVL